MAVMIEKASGHMNRIIDALGYVVMMILTLILWWGIYSGVEITVSSDQSRNVVDTDRSVRAYLSPSALDYRQASVGDASGQADTGFWSMVAAY